MSATPGQVTSEGAGVSAGGAANAGGGAGPGTGARIRVVASEQSARGRGLRLGDGFDALLVRELQQALGSRSFVVLVALALVSMLLIIITVLDDSSGVLTRGSVAFLQVLAPTCFIVCGLVPLQTFFATRQEAVGDAAEALLLTRLTPWGIVRGKLTASYAHMLLWIGLAAPLLALTWLLRGVSVPQILIGLLLSLIGGTLLSAVAVALGTLARFERVSTLVNLVGLAAIVSAAIAWTSWTTFMSSGTSFASMEAEGFAILAGLWAPLLAFAIIVARSQFTHPCENRSTPFRVLLPATVVLGIAILTPWVTDDDVYYGLLITCAVLLGPFLVFGATEEDRLSPWLAQRVPKHPVRAALLTPLLPGGGRALLWGLAMTVLLVAGVEVVDAFHSGSDSSMKRIVALSALYALLYGALGALVRRRLRPGLAGNWIARAVILGIFVLGSVLPALLQLLGGFRSWSPLQILNPFWTIADAHDQPLSGHSAFLTLLVLTLVLYLPQLARLVGGWSDVANASYARRMREG
jgi:hypothetical protein